jgi:hypothetical protein
LYLLLEEALAFSLPHFSFQLVYLICSPFQNFRVCYAYMRMEVWFKQVVVYILDIDGFVVTNEYILRWTKRSLYSCVTDIWSITPYIACRWWNI